MSLMRMGCVSSYPWPMERLVAEPGHVAGTLNTHLEHQVSRGAKNETKSQQTFWERIRYIFKKDENSHRGGNQNIVGCS